MIDESMDKEQMAAPAKPDEFRSKPAWQRLIVMLAGVTLNLLLAIGIYIGISYKWGEAYYANEDVKWGYNFSTKAETLGFKDGDHLLKIGTETVDDISKIPLQIILSDNDQVIEIERNGQRQEIIIPLDKLVELRKDKNLSNLSTPLMPFIIDSIMVESSAVLHRGDQFIAIEGEKVTDFMKYRKWFAEHKNGIANVTILRNAEEINLSIPIDSNGKIGVKLQNPFTPRIQEYTLIESIPAGINKAGNTVASYWKQLSLIVKPETEMYKELGGFVAIGNMFSGDWNWYDFWMKTAFLSIILAVMNVLPIPGLDGAHALFTLWEIITRRKPSDKFLEYAQYVGMFLLFGLLIYANGNDFYRLIFK
ncbi:MAG: site-2 protease family protein, partial [Rikenellaceae bacterium]